MHSRWGSAALVQRSEIPHAPGVYAIYSGSELVYIGSAESIRARLRDHSILREVDREKCTVKFSVARACGDWMSREYRLIQRLRPPLNVRGLGEGSIARRQKRASTAPVLRAKRLPVRCEQARPTGGYNDYKGRLRASYHPQAYNDARGVLRALHG